MGHRAGKLARLVDVADKFGGPIESDFFDRGHNVLDWFTGRYPLSQLMRLVDRLPSHSRYVAALLDDPDLAERMAANAADPDEERDERGPTMEGWDPVVARLTDLIDAMQANTAATIAATGTDPPDFEPQPRPVTEWERARNRREVARREEIRTHLVGLLLGDRGNDIPPGWT